MTADPVDGDHSIVTRTSGGKPRPVTVTIVPGGPTAGLSFNFGGSTAADDAAASLWWSSAAWYLVVLVVVVDIGGEVVVVVVVFRGDRVVDVVPDGCEVVLGLLVVVDIEGIVVVVVVVVALRDRVADVVLGVAEGGAVVVTLDVFVGGCAVVVWSWSSWSSSSAPGGCVPGR